MLPRSLLVLLFCLSAQFAKTQTTSSSVRDPRIDTIAQYYNKAQYKIEMRDGVSLFTTVYTPRDAAPDKKYPVLMIRTPYATRPYLMPAPGVPNDSIYSGYLTRYFTLAKEGYIFVLQDVRGRYMSEGEFVDVRPHNPIKKSKKDIDEGTDTYDAIDWLLENIAHNNGKVGIFGISYPGFYSTAALPEAHPALKAVSPQAPVTDWFMGDDFHHNGALCLADGFDFFYSFGRKRTGLTTQGQPDFDYPTQDNYAFHLEMGALQNYNTKILKGEISFWNDLMAHPNYDAYWQDRNIRPHLKNVKPAVMTVGGLFDAEDCFGAFATYQAIEKQNPNANNTLVMGPWWHGQWARDPGSHLGNIQFGQRTSDFYTTEIEAKFFQHHLKSGPNPTLPEAYIFTTGSNKWNAFDAWPPKNTTAGSFYLQPNSQISLTSPIEKSAFDAYTSDPKHPVPYTEDVHLDRTREYMTDDQRFASRRPDVLTYQTEPFTENLTLVGPLTAKLYVSADATDFDLVVKIIDVFPNDAPTPKGQKVPLSGYQMLVRGEIMRARYRDSFTNPSAVVPDSITLVQFTLPDIAHTYLPGHRLMVQIQSSWFPLMDRNPQQFININTAKEEDFLPAHIKVHRDAVHPSSIDFSILQE